MADRKVTLEYLGETFEILAYAFNVSKDFSIERGSSSGGVVSVSILRDKADRIFTDKLHFSTTAPEGNLRITDEFLNEETTVTNASYVSTALCDYSVSTVDIGLSFRKQYPVLKTI